MGIAASYREYCELLFHADMTELRPALASGEDRYLSAVARYRAKVRIALEAFLRADGVLETYDMPDQELVFIDLFHLSALWQTPYEDYTSYAPPAGLPKKVWDWFTPADFSVAQRLFSTPVSGKQLAYVLSNVPLRLAADALCQPFVIPPPVITIFANRYEEFADLLANEGFSLLDNIHADCLGEVRSHLDRMLSNRFHRLQGETVEDVITGMWRFLLVFYFSVPGDFDPAKGIYYVYVPALANVEQVYSGALLGFVDRRRDVLPLGFDSVAALVPVATLWTRALQANEEARAFLFHARKSARAAIMSRNLSHNLGSHTLANPRLYWSIGLEDLTAKFPATGDCEICRSYTKDEILVEVRQHLSAFHQYTQTRLDFIARTLSPSRERPEPLFFISDVMSGFFRQTVLLDTLLSDRGFSATQGRANRLIRIHVHLLLAGHPSRLPVESVYTFGKKPDGASYELMEADPIESQSCDTRQAVEDLLVGIPGGMVGCHALYSFLENAMRNGAKYGKFCEDTDRNLDLHISLREPRTEGECGQPADYFVLSIWESVSIDPDFDVVCRIRGYLTHDLIDTRGTPVTEGQGIQEMKVSAAFLSGQAADGEVSGGFLADLSIEANGNDPTLNEDYRAFISRLKAKGLYNTVFLDRGQPLRCSVQSRVVKANPEACLVYEMLIPRARLVGIVGHDTAPTSSPQTVRYFRTVQELAQGGTAFGVILEPLAAAGAEGQKQIQDIVNLILASHNALPFRLVVLAAGEDRVQAWKAEPRIERMLKLNGASDGPFDPQADLPARRVNFVADPALYAFFAEGPNPDAATLEFLGTSGWEAAIMQLYHRWMDAFKPPPAGHDSWNVAIGFEREVDHVRARWSEPLSRFRYPTSPPGLHLKRMQVRVAAKPVGAPPVFFSTPDAGANGFSGAGSPAAASGEARCTLVFDNHGSVFPDWRNEWDAHPTAIYHTFSGAELSLYQNLESPPSGPFSFAWFIYQLVEASLIQVAIVDERLAEATLEANGGLLGGTYLRYSSVNLFPIYSVRLADQMSPFRVSALVKESFLSAPKAVREQEGLEFAGSEARLRHATKVFQDGRLVSTVQEIWPDAVVVHEGIVDMLQRDGLWPQGMERQIFGIAPRVIRTSGRGPCPRHLSRALPFIEFSELSESTYRGLNKPSLGRAILSVAGTTR